jgi:acetyl-CoA acetyltransferase family protein
MHSTTLGWRLVNPLMDSRWTIPLGASAEILADRHAITREAQDQFALRSHQRAARAWDAGWVDDEIAQYPDSSIPRDESIRTDTSLEKLAKLKPVFRDDGTVTAGNSSPMNDAAAVVLLGTEAAAKAIGRDPMARIVARGVHAVDPDVFGIAPVQAAEMALRRAGISWGDLVAVELNEAFAAQTLACLACWPELDPERLNVNGGAIAFGHPIAASGARILGALARELQRRGGGYGLATICIGVGQGLAVVLEV